MKAPAKLLNDPELSRYFQQMDYYLYLLWQKTGGGSDPFEDSVQSVIGGNDIDVDDSDPKNPVVNYVGVQEFEDVLVDLPRDEEISSQDSNYTTFTNETVLMTKKGSTLTLNKTPNDKEVVYVILGTDKIKINGNGNNVSGRASFDVYRKYTVRRCIYFESEKEWFVS